MSSIKAPWVVGLLAASLAVLMDSSPAASLAPSGWEQLAGCAERVLELQAEVEALREQLRKAHASEPAYDVSARPAVASWREGEGAGPSAASVLECAVPFEISKAGIKRYKERCAHALQALDPCELPYELDARGVKNFKPGCLARRASP